MALSQKQKLDFYRNRDLIKESILSDAALDNHVIYGAQAVNRQLPVPLNKNTSDFDIFSNNPKKDAVQMEKHLDRQFGGNFFSVKRAKYPNTWKVKSNVTGETIVDYTKPDSKVPSVNIGGNDYSKLSWIRQQIKKTLGKKGSEFRFAKDKETLQRIKLWEDSDDLF